MALSPDAGPYERWVYTPTLGRPYAFPAIAQGSNHYHTGILDGTTLPPNGTGITSRLPPLWNPSNAPRVITPFACHTTAATDSVPGHNLNFPINKDAWTPTYKPGWNMENWVVPNTPPKAIVAVIDDGIAFANRAFLDAEGQTRISHCWLQSGRADDTAAVPFGRELMNGDINAMRDRCGDDEARMYRETFAIDPSHPEIGTNMRRHATHGSHVMGMAAGNGTMFTDYPLGDDVQIIAVQLPNTISWDMSGFGKDMYMLSALHYVLNRAREIAAKYSTDPENPDELPLIINFSYGWSASRHDGLTAIELAIEELLQERQALQSATEIVLPTGNNFDQKIHGQINADDMSNDEYTFKWKLLPDDRTPSYLEVWFPEGMNVDDYTVAISPPNGKVTGGTIALMPDPAHTTGDPRRFSDMKIGTDIIGQLSADKNRGTRWRVMAALIPTVNTRDQSRCAPSGEWTVTIKRNTVTPMATHERINIWIQRDDDPVRLKTGGKQSYLVQSPQPERTKHPLKDYNPPLDFESGYGALNGIAASPSVTRVAGYAQNSGRPSSYSGSGGVFMSSPTNAESWGVQPSISAVSDQSAMRPGTQSFGVKSGSTIRLVGTSGAAPSVTRLMVQNAAAGRDHKHGLAPRLAIHRTENITNPIVEVMHKARTAPLTAPPLTP